MSVTNARGRVSPDINVTPFIDILLVLLIIFMVITPLKPTRFKTLVPEKPPDDAKVHKSPRTLVVEVGRDLSVRLLRGETSVAEGTVADAGAVAARLADEWRDRKAQGHWKADAHDRADLAPDQRIERTVFVRAPRSVRYGEVAKVIDAINGAGANPVGLQTDELPHE